jgi:hypothetical protein
MYRSNALTIPSCIRRTKSVGELNAFELGKQLKEDLLLALKVKNNELVHPPEIKTFGKGTISRNLKQARLGYTPEIKLH